MKRVAAVLTTMGALSLILTNPLVAQQSQPIDVANLFTWLASAPPDWVRGILYSALGLVGALVVVFTLVGGAVPGTAGFARIEADLKRVEEREKILDDLLKAVVKNPAEIAAVEVATNNLRDDVAADRRRQFALAAAIYTVLGAFFAAMLARDVLQALVVGAGWTSYLGALGLKKDYAERKSVKDEATERLETIVSRAIQGAVLTDHEIREAQSALSEAVVSKAL
jgi:hypothetical protein